MPRHAHAPLLPLVDEGGVVAAPEADLHVQLERLLGDPAERAAQGRRGRDVFLRRFSYSAVRPTLDRAIGDAVSGARSPAADVVATLAFQRSVFGSAPGFSSPPGSADAGRRAREVEQIHAAVAATVPAGTGPIAVVSRGDDDLIRFEGRVGWHFPRSSDGGYAGYYPEDSDAAIRHLEELRRLGARYLVVPASSSWCLDHYAGFRDHLLARYRHIDAGDGVSALVELGRGGLS